MPNIRRFLLDHNVTWPNLINGPGDRDYAGAYGVTQIPANVLIGRDGTVIHLDLTRSNLEAAVEKARRPVRPASRRPAVGSVQGPAGLRSFVACSSDS